MPSDELKKAGKALVKKLVKKGVTGEVRINFSGSGDEGSIEGISGIDRKHPLYNEVHDWADSFADDMPVDWVNNDGGSGWIEMNLDTKEISYEVSYNEMQTHVAEKAVF